ncbi:MAG TPA: IPT/TIG domain-containing protein [Bryobacteraceae bacterium]|nr:IPT/TIG domain-containing protein [Bryobacteraceae bacterium]
MRLFLVSVIAANLVAADVSYKIDTVAGSDWVGDNGPAASALLFQADGIAADSKGNLYISDAANHRIRRIDRAGVIMTIAGTGIAGFSGDNGPANAAQLNSPYGLALDGIGNLYLADLGNARVRRIGIDGTITTIAGGGAIPAGGGNDGTVATLLSLGSPRNVAWDGHGALFISDFTGHRVYRLAADGSLTTAAGNGVQGFSGDGGPATRAQLAYPAAIASDTRGTLYIGDSLNHLIRKVAGGTISSIARAATPSGMTIDTFGTIYVADPSAGQLLALPVTGAPAAFPISAFDICFKVDGYLYATDGKLVRRISFTGPSTMIAGGGSLAFGDHGDAKLARLNHPSGVSSDGMGNIYIADRDNHRIRRVAADGTITTVAGTGDAGDSVDGILAQLATLNAPSSVAADGQGNVYIADTGNHRVRMVSPNGAIRGIAVAGLNTPSYVLPDANGNLYVADSGHGTILKVTGAGTTITIASGLKSPRGLALDANGALYFTEIDGKHVKRLGPLGDLTWLGEGIWSIPRSVAVDNAGIVFVADSGLQEIFRIDPSGVITRVAGTGSAGLSGDGGDALSAQIGSPWDLATGPGGVLYIADQDNNRIRRLTPGPANLVGQLAVIAAVNAASLQPGPLAPGMLLYLQGTGIATADNAQVLFGGIAATILSIDTTRMLVRVPPQIAGQQSVRIQVLNNSTLIGELPAAVVEAAPALFANTSGQLIAINEDGSANSPATPVARGSIVVFFGTGEGVASSPISVSIGGYSADVLYAGPVTGYPGLLQINARVPAGYVPPGILEVLVYAGLTPSQPGVTLAVN